MGHKGALFPWESADKGVETTPPYGIGPHGEMIPILSGLLEHHISADVGWATWEYWKGTGDDEFMERMGVELLLETARFWVSRASRDELGPLPHPDGRGPRRVPRGRRRQRLHQRAGALQHRARPRRLRLARASAPPTRRPSSASASSLTRRRAHELAQGRRRAGRRLRPGDRALRAVRRLLRHGRRRPGRAGRAPHGRRPAARPRRHAQVEGRQAGRRRHALPRARPTRSPPTWRSPTTTTTSRSPATAARCRRASTPPLAARLGDVRLAVEAFHMAADDRSRRQHGQRGPRPAHGHHGRPVAGGRDGLRRRAAPRRGAACSTRTCPRSGPRCRSRCASGARGCASRCARASSTSRSSTCRRRWSSAAARAASRRASTVFAARRGTWEEER